MGIRRTGFLRRGMVRAVMGVGLAAGPAWCGAAIVEGGYGVTSLSNAGVYAKNQAGYLSQINSDGPLQTKASTTNTSTLDNLDSREDQYSRGFNPSTGQFEYGEIIWASSMYATARATVSPGELHLYGYAHAANSPGVLLFNDYAGVPQAVANPLKPWASAQASGQFQDTLTVTSSTLAPGTPVVLRSTMSIHGNMTAGPGANGWITASLTVGHKNVGPMTNPDPDAPNANVYGLYREFLQPDGSHTLENYSTSIIHTFVGDQLTFNLQAVITAAVGLGAVNALHSDLTAETDLGNTIFLNLDPITAGTGFTTVSGTSYVTPVPEPASGVLLGVGAAMLLRRGGKAMAAIGAVSREWTPVF